MSFDPKLKYLVGQFVRSRNRKFADYVIQRLWSLVCDLPVRLRTHIIVKVRGVDGIARPQYADVFFPEAGLAVYCEADCLLPEESAGSMTEQIRDMIRNRAADVFEGLVTDRENILRTVVVTDRPWENIEAQIRAVASEITERVRARQTTGGCPEDLWRFLTPETWCATRREIRAGDPVRFPTVTAVGKLVFGCRVNQRRMHLYAFAEPPAGIPSPGARLWFPKLTSVGGIGDGFKWINVFDPDDGSITELPPQRMTPFEADCFLPRITFVQGKNWTTGEVCYAFAGIYTYDQRESATGRFVYRRTGDRVGILTGK